MSKILKLATPVARATASFHTNNAGRQIDHERGQLVALDLFAKHYVAALIYPVDLKHVLGQVDSNRCNRRGIGSFVLKLINPSTLAHQYLLGWVRPYH